MKIERPWPTKSEWVTRAEYHAALKQAPFKALTRRIVDSVADYQNDGENKEHAFPSLPRIAKDAGCDVSAVKKHIVIAENSGWIARRPKFPNNKESVNEYQLLIPAEIDRKALRYPGSIGAYPGSEVTSVLQTDALDGSASGLAVSGKAGSGGLLDPGSNKAYPGSNKATKVLKEGEVKDEQVKKGNSAIATLRPLSEKTADPDLISLKKYVPNMPKRVEAWADRHCADFDKLKDIWETHCCEWDGGGKPTDDEGMKKFYGIAKSVLGIETDPAPPARRPRPADMGGLEIPF